MVETVKGLLEQKDIKNIRFEYDASNGSIILNVQVTPGTVAILSKNMDKPKEKFTFPSLTFTKCFGAIIFE